MWWFFLAASFFYGLCFGSFATAMAYRIPRNIGVTFDDATHLGPKNKGNTDKPQKMARSQCPSCGHVLGLLDLVPFFSWVFARGKCRYCKCKIPVFYPAIELSTAFLSVLFFLKIGVSWEMLAYMIIVFVLVTMVVIDLQFKILPNSLNLILFIMAPVIWFIYYISGALPEYEVIELVKSGVIASIIYGAFSYVIRAVCSFVLKKEAMGLGDVKLFFAVGPYLGFLAMPQFLMISGLSGIVLGMIWKKVTGEATFPFGPSLIFSFIICLLWGQNVLILL